MRTALWSLGLLVLLMVAGTASAACGCDDGTQQCTEATLYGATSPRAVLIPVETGYPISICFDCHHELEAVISYFFGGILALVTAPLVLRRRRRWPAVTQLHAVLHATC